MRERATDLGWRSDAISTIDPVRNLLRQAGFEVDRKGPAERRLLAEVGDATENYNSFRTQHVIDRIQQVNTIANHVMFVHLREPALITKLKGRFPIPVPENTVLSTKVDYHFAALVVRNPNAEHEATSNEADANVLKYKYDYMVVNNSSLGALLDASYAAIEEILKRA